MPPLHAHLFVCTNTRPEGHPRGSCRARGADGVLDALKAAAHERGLKRVVRVQGTGCLDQCEHGVSAVSYPAARWYGGVTPQDAAALIEQDLLRDASVESLRIPESELNGRPWTNPEEDR